MRTRNRGGFTLIELSLVLVIIGLLVGGLMAGRELIRTAELRKQINQFGAYDVAINAFRLKYDCLPGSCVHGVAQGLAASNNGDYGPESDCSRLEDDVPGSCPANSADRIFFLDLRAARLMETPSVQLANSLNYGVNAALPDGALLIKESDGRHYLTLMSVSQTQCGGFDYCPLLAPSDAWHIDGKLDDGLPYSGGLLGEGEFTDLFDRRSEGPAGAASPVCIADDAAPQAYNLAYDSRFACTLAYQILR